MGVCSVFWNKQRVRILATLLRNPDRENNPKPKQSADGSADRARLPVIPSRPRDFYPIGVLKNRVKCRRTSGGRRKPVFCALRFRAGSTQAFFFSCNMHKKSAHGAVDHVPLKVKELCNLHEKKPQVLTGNRRLCYCLNNDYCNLFVKLSFNEYLEAYLLHYSIYMKQFFRIHPNCKRTMVDQRHLHKFTENTMLYRKAFCRNLL